MKHFEVDYYINVKNKLKCKVKGHSWSSQTKKRHILDSILFVSDEGVFSGLTLMDPNSVRASG